MDDITFCLSDCQRKDCYRHPSNIQDRTIPHSYADFKETETCPEKMQLSKEDAIKGTTFDCISRQAVINEMKDMYTAAEKWGQDAKDDEIKARAESCMETNVELKLRIEKLPSAQPEIIRCRDCKYCDSYIAEITSDGNMERMEYRCKDFHASVMPDDYCSRGKRRDG